MKFSVLMSVYSKEKPEYLRACLESLIAQTIRASEVVVVEDGPLPRGIKYVIEEFREQLNIKSVILDINGGLANALNEGLKYCSYDYVARMDSDDIALPNRFELQVNFMTLHPEITASGGFTEEFNEEMQKLLSIRKLPLNHDDLVAFSKKRSPLSHVTVMFRKSDILSVGGYPNIYPEDYPLWSLLIAKSYKIANIPNILVKVRTGDGFISRRGLVIFKGEYRVFKLQRDIGLLNFFEFWRNVIIRVPLRLSPIFIRRLLYKYAR